MLSTRTGRSWNADQVAVTAGAKQALFNIALALFDSGDEVIIPSPHWTTFPAQVKLAGATPVLFDTRDAAYQLDVSSLARRITPRTKAIVLNSPHNPTGTVYSNESMREVGALAQRHGLFAILDQCYGDFVFADRDGVRAHDVNCFDPSKLLVVDSFSKAVALTGWRLGYVAGDPALIAVIRAIQTHTTSNPNSLAQAALCAAMPVGWADFTQGVRAKLGANRDLIVTNLCGRTDVRVPHPEGGFFAYLDVRDWRRPAASGGPAVAEEFCTELLKRECVMLVPGTAFGDPHGVRLSFTPRREVLDQSLQAIVRFLDLTR
ncbi:aminotransferase class I/II-fold pyridoxal phosphate-dependent enzyme [Verminephrobacter aporrectodeae subsp. tuberculatae]|nr:aminotransferase class I/II-fold pyridoxal phosphate-dependent enzyme [Verminephrobacter aporrectodeae]MCW8209347.1 aminotransferase class I/II-fold pyridoxal phosphate-dependent enzyme [Verminephrobacter aporrectodeae subsp. tuberculatae]